jgi:hypothetical protein
MIEGWYYLHVNGQLLYKRELGGTVADLRDSYLVRAVWPVDPTDRAGCWRILVEAWAADANRERVTELAQKWGCDDIDAHEYASRIGAKLVLDGSNWCATKQDFVDLQTSPAGFGATCLEALANLAKALGYKPHKLWGAEFSHLLKT